jgi:hypothetical protein
MIKKQLPAILERVRKCNFCGREVEGTALAYEENPFCRVCLGERLQQGRAENTLTSWAQRGEYLVSTDLGGQKLQ